MNTFLPRMFQFSMLSGVLTATAVLPIHDSTAAIFLLAIYVVAVAGVALAQFELNKGH